MFEEVAKGIYRIPVPLPRNDLRVVNTYLVRGERDLLIDTGFDMDECEQALDRAFASLGVSRNRLDVLVTHLHPDHSGLARRFASDGARIYRHIAPNFMTVHQEYEQWLSLMVTIGKGRSARERLERYSAGSPEMFSTGDELEGLLDIGEGDRIEVGDYCLHCIETPGHHHSHVCLYDPSKKILFAGDHVLQGITPSITAFVTTRNPLAEYFASLDKVAALDVELTLPAHRNAFGSPCQRIEEIKAHHRARLEEMVDLVDAGADNLLTLASRVEWSNGKMTWEGMPLSMKGLAIGEVLAHLVYLESVGQVVLSYDGEGVLRIGRVSNG